MYCYTQCPQPCSRPLLTHTSTGNSWTLIGKSGSVSCGVTAPFSWVLVHAMFCLFPPHLFSQYCVSSGSSMVGLTVTSSKRAYGIPKSVASRAPAPAAGQCAPTPPPETLDPHRQVWVSLLRGHCFFLLGPGAHKVLFVPSKSLFPHPV